MKDVANLIAAFSLGAVVMFALSEFLPQRSEMLTVAYAQDYQPRMVMIRKPHYVDTIEQVNDLCGGQELKFGCLKELGDTVQFVCLKSKRIDCLAHEVEHLIYGPRHAGE